MKNSKTMMAATVLMAVGYASFASAHSQTGAVGLATSGVARTDVYSVSCYNNGAGAPAKLYLRVKDLKPVKAPRVRIQAAKGTKLSALSTDTVDGDAIYSTGVIIAGGAGPYSLKVNKAASTVIGIETYVAEFHCQTSGGAHTGTSWEMTQNG